MDTKSIAFALAGTAGIVSLGLSSGSASAATAYNNAVLASNPSYYWTFDEASGDAINQVGGLAADNLTPSGNATRGASGTTAGGVSLGTAGSFSGGRFIAANLSGGALSTFAIEFWTKYASGTDNQYLMAQNGNQPSVISGFTDGFLEAIDGGRSFANGPAAPANNAWHHVVIGFQSASPTFTFIVDNGTPIAADAGSASNGFTGTDFNVGGSGIGDFFTGSIDEVAIYDLASAQSYSAALSGIAAHYNVSAAPEPTAIGFLGLAGLLGLRRRRNV